MALRMMQSPQTLRAGSTGVDSVPSVVEKTLNYMGVIRSSHNYWHKFKLHTLAVLRDK